MKHIIFLLLLIPLTSIAGTLTECYNCNDSNMKYTALSKAITLNEDKIAILDRETGNIKIYKKQYKKVVDTFIPYMVEVTASPYIKLKAKELASELKHLAITLTQHPWAKDSSLSVVRMHYPIESDIYDFLTHQSTRDTEYTDA